MKRFPYLIIGFLAGVIFATSALAYADQPIKLWINGKYIDCDVPPQSINGRVLVPARYVAEALGAQVGWDAGAQTVSIWTDEYETSRVDNRQQSNSSKISTENTGKKEFTTKAIDIMELCTDIYKFSGGASGDVTQAKKKLQQLETKQLDLRALSVSDEHKELKRLVLEMSYKLQKAAEYKILYLQSNNSGNKLRYIVNRNDYLKQTVNLLADCTAELDSLKKKGLW